MGGTGTAGMHPDMKRKVGAMMEANPRISVTSGLRDTNMQRRLKKKGHSRVSGKPSAHTRGMAADLGPPSEYGWIMKNASKFGLKSGKSQGEPWHVGMGDVGDWTQDLQNLLSSDVGVGGAQFAGGLTALLQGLFGVLGLGGTTQGPEYQADLYDKMYGAQQDTQKGLTPSSISYSSRQGSIASGVTTDAIGRAKIAAEAAYKAGFRGDALFKMVSIAGRESDWTADKPNPNTSDRGMWQINKEAHKESLKAHGWYSDAALYDVNNNAVMAFEMSNGGANFSPWKGSDSSTYTGDGGKWYGKPGWSPNGDPLWRTESKQPIARAAINALGLGDMEAMAYAGMPPTQMSSSGGVQFHNTFQISGGGNGSGAGGIDVRRTVTMIADELESEMKRRLTRTN
jgi:hypothetical protein